ncbi:BrnA antitoxin family protein [Ferrovibrio sp.]|uniref:BrnA antitoxin family protein n=1 Tax=Ferrovibrio sp. TaxID=1917215 RepID=UPI0035B373CE
MKPGISDALQEEAEALAALGDTTIDFSDLPEVDFNQPGADGRATSRGRFYRPVKRPVTMRLDADVMAFFQAQGEGYQTRINTVLRKYMVAALSGQKKPVSGHH